jgi:hypothetical protein
LLAGLQFDVQIETAQGVSFQTSLAKPPGGRQFAPAEPWRTRSSVGRINITQA